MFRNIYSRHLRIENRQDIPNGLENLESHGIWNKPLNIRELPQIPKFREYCCMKFTFSLAKDPNFENFPRETSPQDPIQARTQ